MRGVWIWNCFGQKRPSAKVTGAIQCTSLEMVVAASRGGAYFCLFYIRFCLLTQHIKWSLISSTAPAVFHDGPINLTGFFHLFLLTEILLLDMVPYSSKNSLKTALKVFYWHPWPSRSHHFKTYSSHKEEPCHIKGKFENNILTF